MKPTTILYAVGAFAAAAGLVYVGRKTGVLPSTTGDQERMAGVSHLYATSTGQQAGVQAAVADNWAALQRDVFATQPDFWV
jgi:hypothetical protein